MPGDSGQARAFPQSGGVPYRWTSDCGTVSSRRAAHDDSSVWQGSTKLDSEWGVCFATTDTRSNTPNPIPAQQKNKVYEAPLSSTLSQITTTEMSIDHFQLSWYLVRRRPLKRRVAGSSPDSRPLYFRLSSTHTVYSSGSLTWLRLHLSILENNQHAIPNQFHQFYQQETQKRKQPSEMCPGTCPGTGAPDSREQAVNNTWKQHRCSTQESCPGTPDKPGHFRNQAGPV